MKKMHRDYLAYLSIVKRNVFTPLVGAIAVLAISLTAIGEPRDAAFISIVITLNILIAIFQESRAHYSLRKLEILYRPRVDRLRPDGKYEQVTTDQVWRGDVLRIQAGDQIPADGTVSEARGLECDESLLTGESQVVTKDDGDTVYAGSIAMAGDATMKVMATGIYTKAGEMTANLKRYKPELTPLQLRISRVIQGLTYGALAVSILILIVYTMREIDLVTTLKTITTAGVVIVPEGLLLASTLLLAFGSINLARQKVLPQKLSAIEGMALLNILCMDKTGTLTSDVIELDAMKPLGHEEPQRLAAETRILVRETSGKNATGRAMLEGIPESQLEAEYTIEESLPFSSGRKMSAVRMTYNGKSSVLSLGAPEVLADFTPLTDEQKAKFDALAAEGLRVLLLVRFETADELHAPDALHHGTPAGVVVLRNPLRQDVQNTVAYLQKEGVGLRVISGDNPKTVQRIAQLAGVEHTEASITGAELAEVSDAEWNDTVLATTVFARIYPEQKQKIIKTFRNHGHFTGMVGDGVNDALAIKEADFGVAMFAGASATRRIADVVLLDNSFTSLPMGMQFGNRIMQAIEMIASLFFNKIIYGLVLLFITIAIHEVYPFLPRHITFMNIFLVTLPTLLWTLFPPEPRGHVDPRLFWRRTIGRITPIAVLTGAVLGFTYWWLLQFAGFDEEAAASVSTTTVIVATIFGMVAVFLVPRLFRLRHTKVSRMIGVIYVALALVLLGGAFGVTPAREFFAFTIPAWQQVWLPVLLIGGVVWLQYAWAELFDRGENAMLARWWRSVRARVFGK